nr:uncharacterized protein LOC107443204 isoform X2 [Parasteatoda tepidariorum]
MSLENLEKYNYNLPVLTTDSEVPTNGDNANSPYHQQTSFKRPRTEDYSVGMYSTSKLTKNFLSIRHNCYIYHTEDWKPKGCTMYLPLREDIMINTQNIEQISFENDQFFLADEKGNYVGAKPGNAVHFWRFDGSMRKLYISRSILFLKDQDYQDLQVQLDNL